MQKVLLIDKNLIPQDAVCPAVARILLKQQKAFVHKRFPFVIRLGVASTKPTHGLQLKLDPGSVTTGIALVNNKTGEVVWGANLFHRGKFIKQRMDSRSALRRGRRYRKTRYRPARFLHRKKPDGWLAPSLMSRVYNIDTWVKRLRSYAHITGISVEFCNFDMQKMNNPSISGKEYQRGELFGFEVREYILQKYDYTCVYCGAKDVPLEMEHVVPRAKGGTNRTSNLVLACKKCNQKKGSKSIDEFLSKNKDLLKKIKSKLKASLKDVAIMHATRNRVVKNLTETGLPVELGYGYLTKFNRTQQGLPKHHWIDAACVGESTPVLKNTSLAPLQIKAQGHGSRQMCRTDKFGFPKCHCLRSKRRGVFQTGDMVCAVMLSGKSQGFHVGRLITRARPSFKVGSVDGIHPKHITLKQRNDGYSYVT